MLYFTLEAADWRCVSALQWAGHRGTLGSAVFLWATETAGPGSACLDWAAPQRSAPSDCWETHLQPPERGGKYNMLALKDKFSGRMKKETHGFNWGGRSDTVTSLPAERSLSGAFHPSATHHQMRACLYSDSGTLSARNRVEKVRNSVLTRNVMLYESLHIFCLSLQRTGWQLLLWVSLETWVTESLQTNMTDSASDSHKGTFAGTVKTM